jgi:CDP-diglyceride synthetase
VKLENFADLYFVVAVFVPGFIYCGVISTFVPLRALKERESLLLRYLTATAFNYAILSPLIYLLVIGYKPDNPVAQSVAWFFILFVSPVVLAMVRAKIIQRNGLGWFYERLGLRAISPIPTGWDWIFSTTDPCFVLITLIDGTEIAGYFGKKSMASSDPDHKDIFIQLVYTVPANGGPWVALPGSLGVHIDGAQIGYMEFRERGTDG